MASELLKRVVRVLESMAGQRPLSFAIRLLPADRFQVQARVYELGVSLVMFFLGVMSNMLAQHFHA